MASPRRKHIAITALAWAGYTDEEIAEAVGYTPATVYALRRRHKDCRQADEDVRQYVIATAGQAWLAQVCHNGAAQNGSIDRLRELVAADGPIADRFADRPCPDCPLIRDRTGADHGAMDAQTQTQGGGDTPAPDPDPS